jgi:hypothetical protein
VVGSNTAIRVFGAESGERVAEVPSEGLLHAMAFDADRMYAADGDGVRVFDTAGWAEIAHYDVGPAFDLALSPDGSRLAVGTRFEEVLVVDPATGAVLQSVSLPGVDFPAQVAFADDDHLLVGTPFGDPVIVLTLDPDELVGVARAGVTRLLTAEECETYRLDPCPTG